MKLCDMISETPGGGRHLRFARTPGVKIRTIACEISDHVDTRGHTAEGKATGYIIAPGSKGAAGEYRILKGGPFGVIRPAPLALLFAASMSPAERDAIADDAELRIA